MVEGMLSDVTDDAEIPEIENPTKGAGAAQTGAKRNSRWSEVSHWVRNHTFQRPLQSWPTDRRGLRWATNVATLVNRRFTANSLTSP
jgi:hypothetical protein